MFFCRVFCRFTAKREPHWHTPTTACNAGYNEGGNLRLFSKNADMAGDSVGAIPLYHFVTRHPK